MAHDREWDRGKSYGDDHNRSGHVRQREDDEYYEHGGNHKRSRYNARPHLNCCESASLILGQDEEYVEEYSYDDRRREHPPRRKLVPSEASQHIIFLGLDTDFTEADVCADVVEADNVSIAYLQLQSYLLGLGAVLNSVTVIRDRATGTSASQYIFNVVS